MSADHSRYPGFNLGSDHHSAEHKAETLVFGFWVFLMSDLILFGLFFATYVTMTQSMGFAGGPRPKQLFDIRSAFAQTAILLTSSLSFGMASISMKHHVGKATVNFWLGLTLLLGVSFLAFELHDFSNMIEMGAVPSRSGFLSAFWGLVPLHGLHVTAGCLWIIIMIIKVQKFGMTDPIKTRLLRLGLFWHFLDIIWIGIFSIVYLGGLA